MVSSFWRMADKSRDLSQAEIIVWVKIVVILWIYSALQAVISFSAWDKSRDSGAKN